MKTIIEKAFDKLWVRFCTNQAEYKNIKNFFLTQLALAEKKGRKKAMAEAHQRDLEIQVEHKSWIIKHDKQMEKKFNEFKKYKGFFCRNDNEQFESWFIEQIAEAEKRGQKKAIQKIKSLEMKTHDEHAAGKMQCYACNFNESLKDVLISLKQSQEQDLCHCHGNDPTCALGKYKIHCKHCKQTQDKEE